jgi:eukaryotic translation initiation factor 2C
MLFNTARVEVIANLDQMTGALMKQFESKLRVKPHRVRRSPNRPSRVRCHLTTSHSVDQLIFFRDGVSEGQFAQILATEVAAIRLACKNAPVPPGEKYEP